MPTSKELLEMANLEWKNREERKGTHNKLCSETRRISWTSGWISGYLTRNPQTPDLSHITPERRGCLTCLAPDCPVWQAADQNCWKPASEREYTLHFLEAKLKQMRNLDYTDMYPVNECLINWIRELREGKDGEP